MTKVEVPETKLKQLKSDNEDLRDEVTQLEGKNERLVEQIKRGKGAVDPRDDANTAEPEDDWDDFEAAKAELIEVINESPDARWYARFLFPAFSGNGGDKQNYSEQFVSASADAGTSEGDRTHR